MKTYNTNREYNHETGSQKRQIAHQSLTTTSKLVRECISVLDALAATHPVSITWVPGHTGKPGNERADQLARQATRLAFTSIVYV